MAADPSNRTIRVPGWRKLADVTLAPIRWRSRQVAFVARQSGDGALANVALDRALADRARYSMAQLLRDALDSGAPPSMARLPMTPEEVAAAYDAAEAAEDAEQAAVPAGEAAPTSARPRAGAAGF